MQNSFDTRSELQVDDASYEIYRLDRIKGSDRLPYSLKVLLENLLRNEDGRLVTPEQINALAAWDPAAEVPTKDLSRHVKRLEREAAAQQDQEQTGHKQPGREQGGQA